MKILSEVDNSDGLILIFLSILESFWKIYLVASLVLSDLDIVHIVNSVLLL